MKDLTQYSQVFSEVMTMLHEYTDAATGRKSQLIADDVYEIIMQHKVLKLKIFRRSKTICIDSYLFSKTLSLKDPR